VDRTSSGINGLDEIIMGGFPKSRSILVAGEPGTGKTIFGIQYLVNGAKEGQKGIYVSIDEKPEHVIQDAKQLGWDIEGYLNDGTLHILDVSNYFNQARLGKKDGFNIAQVIDDLKDHIQSIGASRLVVDPISPMVFNSDSVLEISEYIRKLVFELEDESLGCTSILTSHIPVGSQKLGQYGIEEFVTSGVVLLKLAKPQSKYIRTLFVRKMRGTAVTLSEYSFDIVENRGIIVRQAI
jgi:circadian clock protein KaiC